MGGLGNQLFIIFATIAYAAEHRLEFRLPRYRGMLGLDHSPRPAYWDTLLRGLRPHLAEDGELDGVQPLMIHEEMEFQHRPLPPPSGNDRWICLHGYFQHPGYAEPQFRSVLDLLRLPLDRYAREARGCVAMHFRVGDYKNVDAFNILPAQYYEKALRRVARVAGARTVRYAMQDTKEDGAHVESVLAHLRRQFPRTKFERLDPGMQDWEQLLFMAQCDHNVIANSTFSWWAARLNPRASRKVAYPDPWFPGVRMAAPADDPSKWIAVEVQAGTTET